MREPWRTNRTRTAASCLGIKPLTIFRSYKKSTPARAIQHKKGFAPLYNMKKDWSEFFVAGFQTSTPFALCHGERGPPPFFYYIEWILQVVGLESAILYNKMFAIFSIIWSCRINAFSNAIFRGWGFGNRFNDSRFALAFSISEVPAGGFQSPSSDWEIGKNAESPEGAGGWLRPPADEDEGRNGATACESSSINSNPSAKATFDRIRRLPLLYERKGFWLFLGLG